MNSTKIEIPIFMRWKVSKKEIQKRLQKCSSTAKAVNFKELPGVKYGLVILKTKENEIQVGLAFRMPKNPTIINAKFKLSVIPAYNFDESIYEKVFKEDGDAWGNPVCSWKEFFDPANNYFINDYIYITLEGIFSFEKEQFCIGFEIKGSNDLKTFYNRDDKNFEISGSDGKCVKVHKLLISTKSSVFKRIIKSDLKKSKYEIPEFDFEIIELAIKFCYGIPISDDLNISNGIKLLHFSDKYEIKDLKKLMEFYLLNEISPMNICKIVNALILSNSIKLREQCFDFMLKCMKEQKYIHDLEILDKEFSLSLFKAFFSVFSI